MSELPADIDDMGKWQMRHTAKNKSIEQQSFGRMSDEWIADRVRMLSPGEMSSGHLSHEAIVTGACDRIMRLSLRVEELEKQLRYSDVNFQEQVGEWMLVCFGEQISKDRVERTHRFVEESIELAQANGCTASEAHQLVDYVFNRPKGELSQEVGGVMVTLAALCNEAGVIVNLAADEEIKRCRSKIDVIRAKQAGKPKHSPLPEHVPDSFRYTTGDRVIHPLWGEITIIEPISASYVCSGGLCLRDSDLRPAGGQKE